MLTQSKSIDDPSNETQRLLREVANILVELARAAEERGLSVAPYFQRLSALGLGFHNLEPHSEAQKTANH